MIYPEKGMIVGCYTLDLYCANKCEPCRQTRFEQYTGENFGSCARQARKRGWVLSSQHALCPSCSGKNRQKHKEAGQ